MIEKIIIDIYDKNDKEEKIYDLSNEDVEYILDTGDDYILDFKSDEAIRLSKRVKDKLISLHFNNLVSKLYDKCIYFKLNDKEIGLYYVVLLKEFKVVYVNDVYEQYLSFSIDNLRVIKHKVESNINFGYEKFDYISDDKIIRFFEYINLTIKKLINKIFFDSELVENFCNYIYDTCSDYFKIRDNYCIYFDFDKLEYEIMDMDMYFNSTNVLKYFVTDLDCDIRVLRYKDIYDNIDYGRIYDKYVFMPVYKYLMEQGEITKIEDRHGVFEYLVDKKYDEVDKRLLMKEVLKGNYGGIVKAISAKVRGGRKKNPVESKKWEKFLQKLRGYVNSVRKKYPFFGKVKMMNFDIKKYKLLREKLKKLYGVK